MEAAAAPRPDEAGPRLLAAATVGALVAVALGIYGNVHDPASDLSITLGFSYTITMKVWLASAAALLAVVAGALGLWMYGKLPLGRRAGVDRRRAPHHRPAGVPAQPAGRLPLPVPARLPDPVGAGARALAVRLPVLRRVRDQDHDRARAGLPAIALPLAGGLLFTLLIAAWLTSGLWFITENGFPSP